MASAVQISSFRRVARYNILATAGVVMVAAFLICALFAPGSRLPIQQPSTCCTVSKAPQPCTGSVPTNWAATLSRA